MINSIIASKVNIESFSPIKISEAPEPIDNCKFFYLVKKE